MGRARNQMNKFYAELRKGPNGELRAFFADKFGVSAQEVGIVQTHLNSWTYVPEQERLKVDVADWLTTSEIVDRMWKEVQSWRELAARRMIRCEEEGHVYRTQNNRCKWCGTRKE